MSKKWQKLVNELITANPEEIFKAFAEETGSEEKLMLKSLYDLVLQNRQREQIAKPQFFR